MATTSVLQFMQKTAEDDVLRQQLEALLGVGDGNISSEAELDTDEAAALKGERAPIVTDFAAQNGYTFSVEELITVVDAFAKHQAGEISDEDLAKITGGALSASENPLKRLTRYMSKTYLGIDLK